MSSYILRDVDREALKAFKQRCRDAGISGDDVLRAVILHSEPVYLRDEDETRLRCQFTFAAKPLVH